MTNFSDAIEKVRKMPNPRDVFSKYFGQDLRGHDLFFLALMAGAWLHHVKNSDYAGDQEPLANFKEAEEIGTPAWIGAYIRNMDKQRRGRNLIKAGRAVGDESLLDTVGDEAIYSFIVVALLLEMAEAVTFEPEKETRGDG